jgi:hypothetical protein
VTEMVYTLANGPTVIRDADGAIVLDDRLNGN